MVDFQNFLNWCESRFYDVQVSGNEIQINSIFKENDQDHKLWCNPLGGKNNIPLGVYHCWKSGKHGTLPGLIMLVDGCSFGQAMDILGGGEGGDFEDIQKKVEDLFITPQIPNIEDAKLELPDSCFPIKSLPAWNSFRQKAEKYLNKRKIPIEGLLVSTSGKYRNRIVIPYYDINGNLIYYNCRAMGDEIPKYRGPSKELGIGKEDVLYIPKYPPKSSKLYLTEGEFDCMTLVLCGLYGAALGGKVLSETWTGRVLSKTQLQILKDFQPVVIALDNDVAGRESLGIVGAILLENGFKVSFIRPPEGFKDWNSLLEVYNAEIVQGYIKYNERPLLQVNITELIGQKIWS
jgi:hypothetical protein